MNTSMKRKRASNVLFWLGMAVVTGLMTMAYALSLGRLASDPTYGGWIVFAAAASFCWLAVFVPAFFLQNRKLRRLEIQEDEEHTAG